MCGRFSIMFDPEELRDTLELAEVPVELTQNENVSPGQGIPVIIDAAKRNIEIFRWGLVPGWAKDPSIGYKMINARAETLKEKPSFKNAFARRRCLIPASGFYEWRQEGSRKQPYFFQLKEEEILTFAGLWEHWQDPSGNELFSCTIITTSPNPLMAEYHDRMPVIFDDSNRWDWLSDRPLHNLEKMLVSYPAEKMRTPLQIDPNSLRNSAI